MTRKEAIQIRDKCTENGGPLAKRASAAITWLLKFCPEPQASGLHPYHKRIVLLFQKRLNKDRRDDAEVRAFKKIQDHITEEDFAALERFYRAPKPRDFDELLSPRRTKAIILIRNYQDELARAQKWCEENHECQKKTSQTLPEPEGWEEHAPGNLGKLSWHELCRPHQYPEIAKELHDKLNGLADTVHED